MTFMVHLELLTQKVLGGSVTHIQLITVGNTTASHQVKVKDAMNSEFVLAGHR